MKLQGGEGVRNFKNMSENTTDALYMKIAKWPVDTKQSPQPY